MYLSGPRDRDGNHLSSSVGHVASAHSQSHTNAIELFLVNRGLSASLKALDVLTQLFRKDSKIGKATYHRIAITRSKFARRPTNVT